MLYCHLLGNLLLITVVVVTTIMVPLGLYILCNGSLPVQVGADEMNLQLTTKVAGSSWDRQRVRLKLSRSKNDDSVAAPSPL